MPLKNQSSVDLQKYFLLGMLVFLVVMLAIFMSSFLGTLLIAIIVVTGVYPIHLMLHKKLHVPPTVSALVSLVLVATIIITPLIFMFFSVANEAASAYNFLNEKINTISEKDIQLIPSLLDSGWIKNTLDKISNITPVSTADIIAAGKDTIRRISAILLGQVTNILKNLSFFLLHTLILLLSIFYFLRDGDKLIHYIESLLPLSENYRKELLSKLSRLSYGIIYGIFGTAIIQGLLVSFALWMVGVSNPAFWGAMATLLSPLPYIGTAIIWAPVVLSLLFGGQWIAALFLFLWGALIVGLADNVVKPWLIGSSTALHPLAVLLVLLGGAFAFGLKGLIFGPFLLTLTLAFLHIYKLEYKRALKK